MVATAAWLTIEPEISLEGFLASEETEFYAAELAWMPASWLKDCLAAEHDSGSLASRT